MALSLEIIEAYDAARPLADKPFRSACYAPYNSMFLDPRGLVRACCANYRYILGDLTKERLDDIWFGNRVRKLRQAMDRYDFALGCEFCASPIQEGQFDQHGRRASPVHALKYDPFPIQVGDRAYPTNLEFNLHNTCNLECVMCTGEYSSSIRTHREQMPPFPRVYGDQFFDDLREYIPHLKSAQFLGGEPFLIVEHFRVWDLMLDAQSLEWCGVTTNGTVYNAKVERVLEGLPIHICVSMDGVTKETFEKIRVNASLDVFLQNFKRFHEYAQSHGRSLNINFAISRLNWFELADALLFAEDHQATVMICPVVNPPHLDIRTLSTPEREQIYQSLSHRDAEMKRALTTNLPVWTNYLKGLEQSLNGDDDASLAVMNGPTDGNPSSPRATSEIDAFRFARVLSREERADALERARDRLQKWSEHAVQILSTDADDVVVALDSEETLFGLGLDFRGKKSDEIFGVLIERFGSDIRSSELEVSTDLVDRIVSFGDAERPRIYLRVISLPRFSTDDQLDGLIRLIGRRQGSPGTIELPTR